MLSIDLFILTNDCITNLAKQIWKVYTIQYKEKRFGFCLTLFTHLVTTKAFLFKLVIIYNANFQITIDKLFNLNKNLFANFWLVAYFYQIKVTYLNFAVAQKLLAKLKISKLSTIVTKLENKKR